ncbi:type B 50S ribosomal protein L31 [Streptacidiphilus sp. PB12-B1b]|nr:type B 50S ribosomal protein L31 [Streptacidiphilus sp. PB12-B1b]
MAQDTNPDYRPVVFRDRSAGYAFLTRSTAASDRTIEWDDGKTYPLVDVEISAESHPFHTGRARQVDPEGEIAKFQRRYGGADDQHLVRTPGPDEVTPDAVLHTGAEGEVSAEDLVLASGRDLNPANLEWARRRLAAEGRIAVEKQLP